MPAAVRPASRGEGSDEPGDVRVVGAAPPVEEQRVRGADGRRERRDLVGDLERDPFERHGQRQPHPGRSEPVDERGQLLLAALDPLVAPAGQAEGGVGGGVQGGERECASGDPRTAARRAVTGGS